MLTAALVAPPLALGAGLAPLKSKTVSFLRASAGRRVLPAAVKSLWNRLMAVGAVNRSWNSAACSSAEGAEGAGGAGVAAAVAVAMTDEDEG